MVDILVDVDGTVSDSSSRYHWLLEKPRNFDAYHANQVNDPPIEPVVAAVLALFWSNRGHNMIIFSTARPEIYRQDTVDWIRKHMLSPIFQPCIYMRPDKDYRPHVEMKRDLLRRIRADGYDPKLTFEDKAEVAQMYASEGVVCLQVVSGLENG